MQGLDIAVELGLRFGGALLNCLSGFGICGDLHLEGIRERLDHLATACFGAMKLQNQIPKFNLLESVSHDLEGRHLLADEQDALALADELGDDVRDGLALARAGRTMEHEADPSAGSFDGTALGGVGVDHREPGTRRVDLVEFFFPRERR